jgi:oxygen-independent coproporphyrinogen-3 oxidase
VQKSASRFLIRPQTIYFGGGTPSSLSIAQLDVLADLRKKLNFSELREWTFEINPATVSHDKAAKLRDLGVNRISMGVQSWNDAILQTLGRIHTARQAESTFSILRDAGFDNISIDLMFAVPGQTRDQWRATLEKTITLRPEHISAYCLTYEEDTEYFRRLKTHEYLQDEDLDADLFEMAMDALEAAGYVQYEVSNYALQGRESLHNFAYWQGSNYLGVGPSSFSTVGEHRWQNVADTSAYTARILSDESPVTFEETVKPSTRAAEVIAFSLRTNRGVPLALLVPWQREVEEFLNLGFLILEGSQAFLTRKGKLMADSVAEVFV